jgi:proteic killer suppression protein
MIRSFGDNDTRQLYLTGRSRKFRSIAKATVRKIEAVDFAEAPEDLRNPPGNHLERLRGDRKGQYSIRVNDQYRVCFRWEGRNAWDVELVDYR